MRRPLALLLLLLHLAGSTGCHKWVPQTQVTPATFAKGTGRTLRIHLADGSAFEAQQYRVQGDSLHTTTFETAEHSTRRVVPLDAITAVEERHGDTAGTIGLVAGIYLAFAVAIGGLMSATGGDSWGK